jgi:uncharacterized protein YkwD
MKNFFIPTHSNNYRAHLIKLPSLFLFLLVIVGFNTFSIIDTSAQSTSSVINSTSLLNQHNSIRSSLGLNDLTINQNLTVSAQSKANQMMKFNCWSHYCPDGKSPWDFFNEANYDYKLAGENLAEGFFDVDDLMTAWMNSITHKDNIIKNDYREVGFGIAYGDYQGKANNMIVVVHFGTHAENAQPSTQNSPEPTITQPTVVEPVEDAFLESNQNSVISNNGFFGDIAVSQDLKNLINLGFIIVLSALFLVDFITLTRGFAIKQHKSFSHYHLILFVIVGLVVMVGGFGGTIGTGSSLF